MHLYSYEELGGIDNSVVMRDGRDILPEASIFTYKDGWAAGYLSGFADWFRYKLLHERGGWWVDTDVICLQPFQDDQRFVFASECEEDEPRSVTNNIIFAQSPGEALFAEAEALCAARGADVGFAETGPVLLRQLVNSAGFLNFVADAETFNPVHYGDVRILLDSPIMFQVRRAARRIRRLRPILLSSKSKAVHLYAHLLNGLIPPGEVFAAPPGSMLAKLIDRTSELGVRIELSADASPHA